MQFRSVLLIPLLFYYCVGHEHFRDRIPNGLNVPNPCKPGETWAGVGHKFLTGGGARNDFGRDFRAHGNRWTRGLCLLDSDGDGRTNGQELGDHNCTWSEGDGHPTGFEITHPGICDPWNDPVCLSKDQDWVMENCKPSKFECEGITQPDVRNISLKIPRTQVPAYTTVYHCQIFAVPTDKDYHIIATTPIINNTDIVHHAVVFGCKGDISATDKPDWCGMAPRRECSAVISLWSLGSSGDCKHSNIGFRMGQNGFTHLALQLHWNNPLAKNNLFDESGMMVYFTPTLRTYDASILTVGQEALTIPPRKSLVKAEATCPSDCMRVDYNGSLFVTAALNHMHYLGTAQYVELYRNGKKIRDIAVDKNYNYDNPIFHSFPQPIEIRLGDDIRTRCEFGSKNIDHTTMFGWGTDDEMCFSFLTFYPFQKKENDFCTSFKSLPFCHLNKQQVIDGCDQDFPNLEDPETAKLFNLVTNSCPLFAECTQDCYEAMKAARQHKCLQGDIWSYIMRWEFFNSYDLMDFLMRLRTCECGPPVEDHSVAAPDEQFSSNCDWAGLFKATPNHEFSEMFVNVTRSCLASGECLEECIGAVKAIRQHRCFQGQEWYHGRRYLYENKNSKVMEFLLDLESCNCKLYDPPSTPTIPSGGQPIAYKMSVIIFYFVALFIYY